MAISDRIAVMNNGQIQHIGMPKDIYQRPANLFVATFIGKSNVLEGDLKREEDGWVVTFENGYRVLAHTVDPNLAQEGTVLISIRPEELLLHAAGKEGEGIRARIDDSVFLGLNTHYFVTLETGEKAEIIQESQIDSILPPGSEIWLTVNVDKFNVFGKEDQKIHSTHGRYLPHLVSVRSAVSLMAAGLPAVANVSPASSRPSFTPTARSVPGV